MAADGDTAAAEETPRQKKSFRKDKPWDNSGALMFSLAACRALRVVLSVRRGMDVPLFQISSTGKP
eukprot:scaffold3311_cov411-Prasinococcus_capsulatus_cf.AAC.7